MMNTKAQDRPVLRRLFERYLELQDSMVQSHDGQYVLIANNEPQKFSFDISEVYAFALENYNPGEFLIQKVEKGSGAYTGRTSPKVIV